MNDEEFIKRVLTSFFENEEVCEEFEKQLAKDSLLRKRVQKRDADSPLEDEEFDDFMNEIGDFTDSYGNRVLSVAWDSASYSGGISSGDNAAWIYESAGVYFVGSFYSDLSDGLSKLIHFSLEEALACQEFEATNTFVEIDSQYMTQEELLKLAYRVCDVEEDSVVIVNGDYYGFSDDGTLVPKEAIE